MRKKVLEIIKAGLDKEDVTIQKACAEMILDAPENDKKTLFELAQKKLGNILVEPPLYNKEISRDVFKRKEFVKTGSGTTLLGGKLKDKTIIRHLQPKAFLAWQKIYEDHQLWKQNDFDYVPIEPIQSYRLNKKGLVDVYSGVLDLSFGSWLSMTDEFKSELTADAKKIETILEKQNVQHGHTHEYNFCLRFFRDANGKVDFNKKPRIYLIDFDQAISS